LGKDKYTNNIFNDMNTEFNKNGNENVGVNNVRQKTAQYVIKDVPNGKNNFTSILKLVEQ